MLFVLVSERESRMGRGRIRCVDLVKADSQTSALEMRGELDLLDWETKCYPLAAPEAEQILEQYLVTEDSYTVVDSKPVK
jgi:hypothetical protein